MTGGEILKIFIKEIHRGHGMNIPDFNVQIDNDFITLDEAFEQVLNHATIGNLRPFVFCLSPTKVGQQFLDDQYTVVPQLNFIDFTIQSFVKRKRSFGFSDQDFGYVALSELFLQADGDGGAVDIASEGYKTYLDAVASSIASNNLAFANTLFGYLSTRNGNFGIILNKTATPHELITIYSYIYYKDLLRGKQLPLNPILSYSLAHGGTVTFTPGVIYEQYFELFDIINELNHSSDIISRYLKVYHILEYLVYRVELVEIERKARVNRTFIREIHGLSGKSQSDKELEILKRNFKKIFANELTAGEFNLTMNAQQLNFINDYFSISTYTSTDASSVCSLIYKIRNSIVHNKESEFHLTSTNPDDYSDLIPVVKQLIQKLEKAIFNKISANAAQIQYHSQNIQLY